MDILDDELLRFWRSLNNHKVNYIMVGGFATRFHGFNRNTEDLDLWLEDSLQNRKNLRQSFIDLDYGDFPSLETMEFVPGWTSFYLGNAIEVDIMTDMKGIEDHSFNECLAMASTADLDGIIVPFLSLKDTIAELWIVMKQKEEVE